jgi:hypothetical protein
MLNKFQVLVKTILENMNAAGAGGAFGTPQQPVYSPDNPVSGNTYAPNDNRNVTGAYFPAKGTKKGTKKGKNKVKPLVIRRTLPKNTL